MRLKKQFFNIYDIKTGEKVDFKLLRESYGVIKIITQEGDEIKFKVRQFYREEKKVTYASSEPDGDSSITVSYYREETIVIL